MTAGFLPCLQELNPGPFAAMILNHTGWIVYAVINIDWFIFVMEAIGLLCGIWLTLSLYPLASLKARSLTHHCLEICSHITAAHRRCCLPGC